MLIEEIKKGKGFSFDLGKLGKNFATAQQFLLTADFASLSLGRHEIDGDNVFVNMQEYTQEEKEPSYEAHAVYADIQLVLQGSERFRWGLGELGELKGDFRPVTGVEKYTEFTLHENQFVIFLPGEPHAPGLPEHSKSFCRKAVIKVKSQHKSPCFFNDDTLQYIAEKYGSPVSRYKRLGPIDGIDFDLDAFELSDGRCYITQGTVLDTCIFQTRRFIDENDIIRLTEEDGCSLRDLIDRKTGKSIFKDYIDYL